MVYEKIPIIEAARRCGLMLNSRTLRRQEVEASCPFCGDRGPGKYHLFLNTDTDQFYCHSCGTSGNSVTLYARLNNMTNRESTDALLADSRIYLMPRQPQSKRPPKPEPADLSLRHDCYENMLEHLSLLPKHRDNLLARGLSEERIERNGYRSMPESEQERRLLSALLSDFHELKGIPGFHTRYGIWSLSGPNGILIPARNKDGLIQGMQIRLDNETNPKRKYRWLSSNGLTNGACSHAWIHITGNPNAEAEKAEQLLEGHRGYIRRDPKRRSAWLTEGGLKGDVASFLSGDDLFVCISGINAADRLPDVLKDLGVTYLNIAIDMDRLTNPKVQKGLQRICQIMKRSRIGYQVRDWNPAFKGIDDYYLAMPEYDTRWKAA